MTDTRSVALTIDSPDGVDVGPDYVWLLLDHWPSHQPRRLRELAAGGRLEAEAARVAAAIAGMSASEFDRLTAEGSEPGPAAEAAREIALRALVFDFDESETVTDDPDSGDLAALGITYADLATDAFAAEGTLDD